jgi:hypothetical protein
MLYLRKPGCEGHARFVGEWRKPPNVCDQSRKCQLRLHRAWALSGKHLSELLGSKDSDAFGLHLCRRDLLVQAYRNELGRRGAQRRPHRSLGVKPLLGDRQCIDSDGVVAGSNLLPGSTLSR